MFYKNWPYWLKGGLLGIIAMAVLIIILIPFGRSGWFITTPIYYYDWVFLPGIIVGFWLPDLTLFIKFWGFKTPYEINTYSIILARTIVVVISVFIYFISGAIIGLIYGKIKNKK